MNIYLKIGLPIIVGLGFSGCATIAHQNEVDEATKLRDSMIESCYSMNLGLIPTIEEEENFVIPKGKALDFESCKSKGEIQLASNIQGWSPFIGAFRIYRSKVEENSLLYDTGKISWQELKLSKNKAYAEFQEKQSSISMDIQKLNIEQQKQRSSVISNVLLGSGSVQSQPNYVDYQVIQPPKRTQTNCSPDYIGGFRCTTY